MSGTGYAQPSASTGSGFGQTGSMLNSGYTRLGQMGLNSMQNTQPSNQYSAFGNSPWGSQPVRAGQSYGGMAQFSPFQMNYQRQQPQAMPPLPAYQASVPSFQSIMAQQQQAQAAQAAAAPQDAYYGPGAGG